MKCKIGHVTLDVQQAYRGKAQQPSAADNEVPDSDASGVFQPYVGDGVDYGEVALGTGVDLKQQLPWKLNACKADARHCQIWMPGVDATADEDLARNAEQLHENGVVGQEVGVADGRAAGLPPPPLETQEQDVDVKRQEEEDMCDGQDCGDDDAWLLDVAEEHLTKLRQIVWMRAAGGVDRHCWGETGGGREVGTMTETSQLMLL